MKQWLKKYLPNSLKNWLIRHIDRFYKHRLAKRMSIKHKNLLWNIEGKKQIKVVFLAIHQSTWKLDPVFKKMLADPYFDPVILVCPYVAYGDDRMHRDLLDSYQYFYDKGYPVLSSYNAENQSWLKLEEISPDLVFFTNPHNLTRKEYYEDAYLNYLSCFCGYGYIVSEYENAIPNFDQYFHSALWLNFATDEYAKKGFEKFSSNRGKNVILTGFPAIEGLLIRDVRKNVWKNQDARLRIIFAPHHTIEQDFELQLSNFLKYGYFFQNLACKYQNETVWCFKPHPLLKSKLYLNEQWGKERTDSYYSWWSEQENTQFCDDEYDDLFIGSDCMIHDSGSFLIEYLTLKKPVLYLISKNTKNTLNSFALRALDASQKAINEEDIENFVNSIIRNTAKITKEHSMFYNSEFIELYRDEMPSNRIIGNIKKQILGKG